MEKQELELNYFYMILFKGLDEGILRLRDNANLQIIIASRQLKCILSA